MFKKETNYLFDDIDINNLSKYKKPIILDFGGVFCPPCQKYEKTLLKIKEEYKDNVLIKTFDVSNDVDIAYKYDVTIIPHQIFINKNGEIIDSHVGLMSYKETIDLLKKCGLNQ